MDPINPQPAQSAYQPTQAQPSLEPQHKKVGPIIAILIIVLVLIIGALYLFASRINEEQPVNEQTVATDSTQPASNSSAESQQTVKPITNNADDISSLQNDLNDSTKGLDNQNF